MSIYHCSIQIIGRSSGRSAVAAAAYRAAEKLEDKETGLTHDYTKKQGVVHREIMLPEYALEEYKNREILWNEVQKIEKRSNAQLAREIEVALPRELSRADQMIAVRVYVQMNFVEKGMCADWVLHDKGDGNPHAHIMLTTRPIRKNGQWGTKEKKSYALDENGQRIPVIDPKTGQQKVDSRNRKQWKRETVQANDWNSPKKAEEWRKAWADCLNALLPAEKQVDHRSYARQGIEQEPTIHEGYTARKREKQGKAADRCQMNREIRSRNALLQQLQAKIKEIAAELAELMRKGEAFYEQRIKRLFIHRTETIGGVYGDAGEGKRKAQKGERRTKRRERGSEQGERAAEQRKWNAAERSPEVAGAVEDEPRVSLGSESAKMPLNGDFSDKGVEYVIEQIKEQIEALQKLEEGMQDDLQKARKFLSEQPEVQPEHKTPKRRTGPKR